MKLCSDMPHSQKKLENLKNRIIEVFENVSYPKGFITEHECEECFGVRKAFLNKDWKDITSKTLEENYDKLPLFSPEAFHCFFPAYLIYSLEHFTEDDEVCDFTTFTLMVKCEEIEQKSDYWKNRFQFFTKNQINLVYEFMDLVIQNEAYDIFVSELECGKQILINYVEPTLKNN
ncbi:MAG: hypothetical protein H0X72_07270 [Acidobacteria bacterium]|nr:hypothetical protein [Acidobacteriota bacterium]